MNNEWEIDRDAVVQFHDQHCRTQLQLLVDAGELPQAAADVLHARFVASPLLDQLVDADIRALSTSCLVH